MERKKIRILVDTGTDKPFTFTGYIEDTKDDRFYHFFDEKDQKVVLIAKDKIIMISEVR